MAGALKWILNCQCSAPVIGAAVAVPDVWNSGRVHWNVDGSSVPLGSVNEKRRMAQTRCGDGHGGMHAVVSRIEK
jgi:hypothetical protein